MFDHILFPTDGSEGASIAFEHVLDIADEHDARVHILNVADTTRDSVVRIQRDVVDVLADEGERVVESAADRARDRGVATVTAVLQGEPYRTIVEYAADRDIDVVVMPTHGRSGLERLLLGSTTERVVRRSTVPVLTINPSDESAITYPYRNVLVATDGSDCANHALKTGIEVASATDAALHLLTVVLVGSLGFDVRSTVQMDTLEEHANDVLDEATARAARAGIEPTDTRIEFAASESQAIRTDIETHDVDLVVVGTHGRTGFDRYLLGSVTEQLIRTADVPVLTVRGPPS